MADYFGNAHSTEKIAEMRTQFHCLLSDSQQRALDNIEAKEGMTPEGNFRFVVAPGTADRLFLWNENRGVIAVFSNGRVSLLTRTTGRRLWNSLGGRLAPLPKIG